jgi:hypothetical protein
VIVDSNGLKVFGEKEWMNHKHGTKQRKVWRKLHLAIDQNGEILSSKLTCHRTSDPSEVDRLLKDINAPICEIIGDGGYDADDTYKALYEHKSRHNQEEIKITIPPNKDFKPSRKSDDS